MDIIYIIIDTKTCLKYIGSKKNWKGHNTYWGSLRCKSKNSKKFYLQQKWKKNFKERPDTFKFQILEKFNKNEIDYNTLIDIEFFYQKEFDILKNDMFVNAGYAKKGFSGDHYSHLTESAKLDRNKRISKSLKDKYSFMTKKQLIKKFGKFGSLNNNYGNNWTQEQKDNLSKKLKGSEPVQKGKTYIEYYGNDKAKILKENLSKIAKKRLGEKNPFYGKKHSEATRKILSKKRKGKKPSNIKKVSIDDKIYEGLKRASIATGIKSTTIWYRIKSKNNKYKNYKYID